MGLTRVTGNIIGLGVSVSGIITATDFIKADGSPVGGGGLGTAITGSNSIYYVDNVLGIGATLTVTVPDTTGNNIAYTQYPEISVNGDADLIISDGDDLLLDVLGIGTDSVVSTTSSTGDIIGNVTGNVTGNLTGNVTGNLTGTASTATAAATAYGLSGTPTLSGITSVSTTNLTVNGNAYPSAGPLSNRNLIINGAMQVAQRGTQATSVTDTNFRTVDRFKDEINSLGTWTIDQSTGAPDDFSFSYLATCTTADASPTANAYSFVGYKVEARDLQKLNYGSSAARAMTLSFWVKSNKTGNATVTVLQRDNSIKLLSPQYSISSADTWEYKTIYIPGDTSGVINNDTGSGLEFEFYYNAGSTYSTGSHQTTWSTYNNANRCPSVLGVGGATSDYFAITGVQLEVGSVATPFEHRSYGDELARCQRYYKQVLALQGFTAQSFFTSHYGTSYAVNIIEAGLFNMRAGVNVSLGPTGNTGNVQYYSFSGSWSSSTLSVTTLGTYPYQQIYLYATADGDGRGKLLRRSGASDPNIYVAINAEL